MDLSGKKVLLTGGAGFLGGFVADELLKRGVRRADIRTPRSAEADLRRAEHCEAAVEGVDLVIHLAARVGGIGFNRRNPGALFYDNAIMGINLMEAARAAKVAKFVQVGTVCAYPKFTPVPFREDDLWEGYPEETNAPYGIAKKALLVMAQAYRAQYGMNAVYLLPVNLYGPRDNFDLEDSHVIPALIRKCVEAVDRGEPAMTAWGTGAPTREFLFVRDCAEAVVAAAALYDGGAPVNIGSGVEVSIRDLTETVARHAGFTGSIAWDAGRPDGQPRRCLDTSRARELFGFSARTGMEAGLAETVSWFRANRHLLK
jgi:GDP-L-fucose synthase